MTFVGRISIQKYYLSEAVAAISYCTKEMFPSKTLLKLSLWPTRTHFQAAIAVGFSSDTINQLFFANDAFFLEEHAFYYQALYFG